MDVCHSRYSMAKTMSKTIRLFKMAIEAATLITLAAAACGALASPGSDEVIPFFTEGKVYKARGLTVGDPEKWAQVVTGLSGKSAGGKVKIEPARFRSIDDAIRVKWSDDSARGEIAIYGHPINLSPLKESSSLMFDVKVHSPPTQNALVGMDCGHPCRAEYDIGGILRAVQENTWVSIPIPLSCFKSSNFDLSKVGGVFMLSTTGQMDLSISNIRVQKTPEGLTSCPLPPEESSGSPTLNPTFFYFVNGELIGSRGITLGDPGKWGLNVEGLTGESAKGKLKIEPEDFQFKDDALRIMWSKEDVKGELGIYGPAINIAPYKDDAALTFDIKLRTLPRESVKVGMDCGYPCRAEFEIGMTLRKLKKNTWTSFPVPLNCLKSSNFDLSKIGGVFLISTSGKLDLSIANVRLEKLPEGTQGCKE